MVVVQFTRASISFMTSKTKTIIGQISALVKEFVRYNVSMSFPTSVHLLTSSTFKIETARLALEPLGVEVIPVSLHLPEIQADTNLEIARHSALEAAKLLGHPVVREDHGFFLHAVSGFPGPYMAYVEQTVQSDVILRLLDGQDRSAHFEMALVYATPDGETIEFVSQQACTVANELRPGYKDFGWDQIICLPGKDQAISEYPVQMRYPFFTANYPLLIEALQKKETKKDA